VNFTLMVDHGQALALRTGRKQQHAGAPTGRRLVCLPVGHL
jgi:hypothetical protein